MAETRVVKIRNKKAGTVYLYEDRPYWDKEKKRPTHRNTIHPFDKKPADNYSIHRIILKNPAMLSDFILHQRGHYRHFGLADILFQSLKFNLLLVVHRILPVKFLVLEP